MFSTFCFHPCSLKPHSEIKRQPSHMHRGLEGVARSAACCNNSAPSGWSSRVAPDTGNAAGRRRAPRPRAPAQHIRAQRSLPSARNVHLHGLARPQTGNACRASNPFQTSECGPHTTCRGKRLLKLPPSSLGQSRPPERPPRKLRLIFTVALQTRGGTEA